MEQIRTDAAALRRAAREADVELATMVAIARSKRRKLSSDGSGSRPNERARELGED